MSRGNTRKNLACNMQLKTQLSSTQRRVMHKGRSIVGRKKMMQRSISLKAYRCPQTGRDIHYSFAHLRGGRQQSSSPLSSNNDEAQTNNILKNDESNNTTIIGPSAACWIFFYPAGPNRRLLEAVISRYTPEFQCDRDVFFICLNRPGKGGTSSSSSITATDASNISPEQEYIRTACNDIITIIDYYQVPKVSLLYMCAGSTFAYSFAKLHSERTTGYILGMSSWILRHDGNRSNDEGSNADSTIDYSTPSNMNSKIHSWAMRGYFGSKSMVSSLAGGVVGSVPGLFNSLPQHWVVDGFKKELSDNERKEFDAQYPEDGGVAFVKMMTWSHGDGDGDGSIFVNVDNSNVDESNGNRIPNTNDGNAKDIAVCLSTQQDLGMEYKPSVPKQKRVLLWHGENDRMVSAAGAEYLESMLSNATLSYVSGGTHQGTMFFFPRDLMLELNQISNLK